jgi:anti-sigma regulatory factor (Ser/Thr protein kinase)
METVRNQILVPADTSKLSALRAQLFELCDESGVPAQTTRRLVLAIDEALANVIEHGALSPQESIRIDMEIGSDEIVATLRDRGVPFDPSPIVSTPDNSRFPRRGFGLYLIQLIVDCIEYRRTDDGENLLILTKRIE